MIDDKQFKNIVIFLLAYIAGILTFIYGKL